MANTKSSTEDPGIVTGLFRDGDSAEQAYQSAVSRGYDQGEISVVMADETRAGGFPIDGSDGDMRSGLSNRCLPDGLCDAFHCRSDMASSPLPSVDRT